MKIILVVLTLCALFLEPQYAHAQEIVAVPEDCSTPWSDDGDSEVNEGCPQSAAFASLATGEYAAPFDDCVLQGMETAADSDPIHGGTIVRLSSDLPWNRQQIRCDIESAPSGTYELVLVYRGTTQVLNGFVKLDSPLSNYPGNATDAFFLPQSAGWKADVKIGQVGSQASYYACVYQQICANQTSPRTFALNGDHSFYLKFVPGLEGACLYLRNPATASASNQPRCTGATGGTPTSNWVWLRTTNAITLDHGDLDGANAMPLGGFVNNTATISAKALWKDDTVNRATIQYETNDGDIVSAMTANDGTFSTAEDHFDFRLCNHLNQILDDGCYQVLGNFNPAWMDANFPAGVRTVATNLNTSISVNGGKMLLAFDLPSGLAAGSQFLCNANARNTASAGGTTHAHMHGTNSNGMGEIGQWGVCELSNTLTSGSPPTDPTPGSASYINVTQSSITVQFDWDTGGTGSGQGKAKFRVNGSGASFASTSPQACSGTTTGCSITITGLAAGTTYDIIRTSIRADGVEFDSSAGTQATAAAGCDYYASNSGGGNGLSDKTPFQIADFWALGQTAIRGKTLCLLDSVYTGANSMINPPQNLNGTATQKITIKAQNDGKVRINGQGARVPVRLENNDHFIIEGIDAHNSATGSSNAVIWLNTGADNNVIRRVCAWDADPASNANVFGVHGNTGNLLEDTCAFGSARKTYSNSAGGNNLTIRRAWGRWEKSTNIGPKITFAIVYRSYDAIYENVIGTWDETAMGGAGVNQPIGILGMDGIPPPQETCTNSKYLGSIAYVRAADEMDSWIGGLFGSRAADCFEFKHVVSYFDPAASPQDSPILGQTFDGGSGAGLTCETSGAPGACDRRFTNVTEIGGSASSIASGAQGWIKTNHVDAATVGAAPNIWNGAGDQGARVCFRYQNGTLTSEKLWPWPLDSRIRAALTASGRDPDAIFGGPGNGVTELMENLFGEIPAGCKS
jgi:hypothetical protein